MREDVIRAIQTIASVPLGGETEEEYRQMKAAVLVSLQVITDAAGFKKEAEEAFRRLLEEINSPEFKEFLKASKGNQSSTQTRH